MPGGSGETTQTTTTQLSPEQRRMYALALPFLQRFAENPPSPRTQSAVAGFTPWQTFSQKAALGAAPAQGKLAQQGMNATNFLLGDVLSPDSNKYLRETIDASTRPIIETLMEETLPGLRGGFASNAGNFSSSRRGVAEGLASGRASQAVGDTAAKVATEGYKAGLDAQGRALGLLPQTQDALLAPARTTGAVGDVRQAMNQAQLNDRLAMQQQQDFWPLILGQELMGVLQGMPGGSTISTAQGPQPNPFAQMLGTAFAALPWFL